jgi:hypothetical protein
MAIRAPGGQITGDEEAVRPKFLRGLVGTWACLPRIIIAGACRVPCDLRPRQRSMHNAMLAFALPPDRG